MSRLFASKNLNLLFIETIRNDSSRHTATVIEGGHILNRTLIITCGLANWDKFHIKSRVDNKVPCASFFFIISKFKNV